MWNERNKKERWEYFLFKFEMSEKWKRGEEKEEESKG
jgi:hypothetical protein